MSRVSPPESALYGKGGSHSRNDLHSVRRTLLSRLHLKTAPPSDPTRQPQGCCWKPCWGSAIQVPPQSTILRRPFSAIATSIRGTTLQAACGTQQS
ncbi:MAG: hypothetical protein FRX49_07805 [Trebouxia sp. A1-2]|nr:MAG: hypothetical protein FRX49_07805 [Trebouxia sp. A1-2]